MGGLASGGRVIRVGPPTLGQDEGGYHARLWRPEPRSVVETAARRCEVDFRNPHNWSWESRASSATKTSALVSDSTKSRALGRRWHAAAGDGEFQGRVPGPPTATIDD